MVFIYDLKLEKKFLNFYFGFENSKLKYFNLLICMHNILFMCMYINEISLNMKLYYHFELNYRKF